MKRFWILILIAGMSLVAMSAYQYLMRPDKGDPAPVFTLPAIDGTATSLEQFRGTPVLLHFWATWCGVCRQEFPALKRFSEDLTKQGLALLAIAEDDRVDVVLSFLNNFKSEFKVLMDGDGRVADAYQSYTVPETVLVDRNGIIAWRSSGAIDWDSEHVREKIKRTIDVR